MSKFLEFWAAKALIEIAFSIGLIVLIGITAIIVYACSEKKEKPKEYHENSGWRY